MLHAPTASSCCVPWMDLASHEAYGKKRVTLGTGGSPGVDMVDATHEVGGGVGWG